MDYRPAAGKDGNRRRTGARFDLDAFRLVSSACQGGGTRLECEVINLDRIVMKRGILTSVACFGLVVGLMAAEEATKVAPPELPKEAPKAAAKPKLKFDQLVYDFGKTCQVETVSGTFTFQNIGDGVLKMGKPTTTCGCTVAGVKPEVLQPGEKGELGFTLTLGRSRAILQKHISVDSNDPDHPRTTLDVKADYTPLYQLTPLSFYFNLRKGESTNLSAVVTRTDGKPFTISKIQPSQPWIEAKVEPISGTTNQSVRILAAFKPEGAPRYFTEVLNVFVEGSGQPFSVGFSGRLIGDLTLTPESIYWPITDPTKAITSRRVVVRMSMPGKLEITNLTSSLPDLQVEAVPKEDGRMLELVAKLSTIPQRTTNGVIRFETNLPGQPKVEVPVWVNVVKR